MSRLLSFDTSTERLCIGFGDGDETLVHEAEGGAQASAQLIPQIVALLARAGCTLAQLDAIAFGRGPGAFTGLRTACSVAQGLALGSGKPVVAVDSLMIVAEAARDAVGADGARLLWVAMDARMDEIYAAAYRPAAGRPGRWHVVEAPALYTLAAFAARWIESTANEALPAIAGSAIGVFGVRLATGAALAIDSGGGRAAALARLAQAQWEDGGGVDAALALPVYLRDKVAQTTAERASLRAAAAPAPGSARAAA